MVQDATTKLIYNRITGEVELYDLEADPAEQRNIATVAPERLARMRGQLDRYLGDEQVAPDRDPLTPEEIETLRALGYVE